ncbi:MAG TPA: molybdopterin-dependent oxidoreductase, partial [Ktedonobacterales bacterium]|nr:molybdopterin-dependent oxidoreductase [Ktedonobacterales bacterium]
GCKTTLGVRAVSEGTEIIRADNRDKSGINGDFLCNKGRYAFDFANNEARLTQPMIRRERGGQLTPVSWEEALTFAGNKLRELRDTRGPQSLGVIGSNRTTNEENYLLQKFARTVLGTNNIDHHRTADFVTLAAALQGASSEIQGGRFASQRDVASAPAILLVGGDPTNQAPLTGWNIRTNVRLRNARVYIANTEEIKLRRQARAFVQVAPFAYGSFVSYLAGDDNSASAASLSAQADELTNFRSAVSGEESLVVLVGNELRDGELARLVAALPNAKFACLADYVNSRGASDMGLLPDMLPGYQPVANGGSAFPSEFNTPSTPGLDILAMFDAAQAGNLSALYVVGSNPVARFGVTPEALANTFLIVQDLFLTDTAAIADVVLPAAMLYEKSGTVTNSYGDVQLVNKGADKGGTRPDFELIVRLADKMGHPIKSLVPFGRGLRADLGQSRGAQMGEADRHAIWLTAQNLEPKVSPFDPFAILDEIQRVVPGYDKLLRLQLLSGNDQHLSPANAGLVQISNATSRKDLVLPSSDTLFTSGSLTKYSPMLLDVQKHQERIVADHFAEAD